MENNEEDDNLGRNPLINNNNNNNNGNNNNNENNNNDIINNLINNNENNIHFLAQYSVFSLSFIIIFLVNFIIWISSFYYEFEKYKYLYEIEPIIDHSQYYRFITRYFVHFGICHLFLELYITLYLCNYFEDFFGTLFSISFILFAMIIDSGIQLSFYLLLSYISSAFNEIDITYYYEGGLTPILFTLNTFFYLFEHDYFNEYNIFLFALGNGKYSSITMLIVLYFFTPNRTFMGNLCGIFGAYFMRKIFLCFLPRISWIIEFEWAFGLNKNSSFYRHITSENNIMKQILNQIEPNCLKDLDMEIEKEESKNQNGHQINNNDINENNEAHQSIIEMSSLSNNNNINNINNQNN